MTLQQKLVRWFGKNARALPWRREYRPYDVWISEIMLQQTRMETAVPYFERWLKAFPNEESLAKADDRKVMTLWQGLGYYSRARNLREAARQIVERHGGKFPERYEDIRALKGVGPYTAGAITSIAFRQDRPVVDGNVQRVLARLFAISEPADTAEGRERFWKLAGELVPKGLAREFNQGLMELGALVCTPRAPRCPQCPLRSDCLAFKSGEPERYPTPKKRPTLVRVHAAAVAFEKKGRYLIRRRPEGEIFGGLWEFPEWKLARGEKMPAKKLRESLRKELDRAGVSDDSLLRLGSVRRHYTHHDETLEVFKLPLNEGAVPSAPGGWPSKWVKPAELASYPLSSAHAKIAKLLKE